MRSVFQLQQVEVRKGDEHILRSIDWTVGDGRITTVLGPSGSGKTSLLRLLNRLDEPTSGQIHYRDLPITAWDVGSLRREVGMVFQRAELFEGTIQENLLFGPNLHRLWIEADQLLELVGLGSEFLNRDVSMLSGGQAQRVSIGRALAVGPRVLLLDEPTTGLDPTATYQIEGLVKRLVTNLGLTCIFVTHDVEQARRMADRVLLLISGQKAEEGVVDEVLRNPKDARTLKFIRGELK